MLKLVPDQLELLTLKPSWQRNLALDLGKESINLGREGLPILISGGGGTKLVFARASDMRVMMPGVNTLKTSDTKVWVEVELKLLST